MTPPSESCKYLTLSCPSEPLEATDLGEEEHCNNDPKEHWVWDNREHRYHLSGRLETDFGYWYPDPESFA
jgi:hypothetical protein